MRKNVHKKTSVLVILGGVILLIINKILTTNSSPDGLYVSALRQYFMVVAFLAVALGILGLIVGVVKSFSAKT
jgi:hypothetical protein